MDFGFKKNYSHESHVKNDLMEITLASSDQLFFWFPLI